MKRLFLMGYFGFGNAGDNFILRKSIDFFNKEFEDCSICVGYNDKDSIQSIFKDHKLNFSVGAFKGPLTFTSRMSFFQVLSTLLKSDSLVYPGGGLLQDATSRRSLFYYLGILLLARLLGKKVFVLSL